MGPFYKLKKLSQTPVLFNCGEDDSARPLLDLNQAKATWLAILVAEPAFYFFINVETVWVTFEENETFISTKRTNMGEVNSLVFANMKATFQDQPSPPELDWVNVCNVDRQ